tara:strand:+ start:52 stop:1068 length:1017 start_codon:yes stop_codon:yes gene_type:complete
MGGVVKAVKKGARKIGGGIKKIGRKTGLNKVVRKAKKGAKKASRFVGKAAKKVGKTADKLTGGLAGKFLKKTGLGKVGQGILNTLPHRVANRVLQGDKLIDIAKDGVKGHLGKHVAKASPLLWKAAGKIAGGKDKPKALPGTGGIGAPGAKLGESFMTGSKFADKVLGKDGMGRMRGRKDIEEVMGIKRKRMEEGISSRAQEALRSKLAQGMNEGAYQAGLKSGAAMGGLKGGAADAQKAAMQANLMGKQANIARDIFLDAEKAKIAGEKDFSEAVSKTASYDTDAMRQEKALRGQFGMGFEQMASADRQAALGAKAAQAQAPQKSGGVLSKVMDFIF